MNTFESLFVNYQPRLVTYADSIVKDHSIALDMVQDTFFTFWKKYSGQDEKSSARLLFAMTRNRCINYLKRERLLNYVDLSFWTASRKRRNSSALTSITMPLIPLLYGRKLRIRSKRSCPFCLTGAVKCS